MFRGPTISHVILKGGGAQPCSAHSYISYPDFFKIIVTFGGSGEDRVREIEIMKKRSRDSCLTTKFKGADKHEPAGRRKYRLKGMIEHTKGDTR